ncbi:MAG TPA: amino acid adenylation domain-containing protein, partial [Gammaproteobacteria bacterium]
MTGEALRDYLAERLPSYMVPSLYMPLPVLPRLPNGKLNRLGLPAPDLGLLESDVYEAPSTLTEQTLAEIWSQVLQLDVDKIGRKANFFTIGGHSLLATSVVTRLREQLSVALPLRAMFEYATLQALAGHLDALLTHDGPVSQLALQPVARTEKLPLSFSQQRLWFIHQFHQGQDRVYNIPIALRLEGELNVEALRYALNTMIERHENLRTRFVMQEGEAVQVIAPQMHLELPVLEVSEDEVSTQVGRYLEHVFDLSQGPLFIAGLLRTNADRHVLLLNMHHIISDRWSEGVMVREVAALYRAYLENDADPLPALPVQYADFAYWQRQWLQGEVLEKQAAYWREALQGAPALLELPTDRPRPAAQTYNGAYDFFTLEAERLTALKALSREEDVTLFMVLLAAFKVLLARYARQDDIAVGTTIANRTRPELENLIGFFANTLVLRSRVSLGTPFRELLRTVKATCVGAYDHQDIPFEYLLDVLQTPRRLSHSPLFQVMFNLHNAPQSEIDLPGLKIASPGASGKHTTAKFDLTLEWFEAGDRLRGRLEYNTDLFDRETVQRLIGHYRNVLEAIAAAPWQELGRLPLLTEGEYRQLVHEWNATARECPADGSIHRLFEAQVLETPESIALIYEDWQLSYAELNARANRVAYYLLEQGVGPDTTVGLYLERSIEMVVGLLGILKAGGCYLPLDPAYPATRLAYMLEDSGASIIFSQRALSEALPAGDRFTLVCLDEAEELLSVYPADNPRRTVNADHLAYIIYTSGSTGRPKGVMSTHGGLVNRLAWMQRQYRLDATDRVLQKTPYTFDVSVWEFLWPLSEGASLVMARPQGHKDPGYLAEVIEATQITTMHFVPSMLNAFLSAGPPVPASLRRVICSGEALSRALMERFNAWSPDIELHNLYGPTEASIDVSHYSSVNRRLESVVGIPIGQPIDNIKLHILDTECNPVPVGVAGELHIGGVGLARGYLKRAGLTAEKFIPDPFSETGGRLYRTGDLTRYLPDGNIEFLGRIDHQVKLRGLRIELGEIEYALRRQEGVGEAVLSVYRPADQSDDVLTAYVVSDTGQMLDPGRLREALQAVLPDYMIPAYYVQLDELPLSPNGKLDRKSLPAPEAQALSRREYKAPETATERLLVEVWSEVLKLPAEQIGVHDNFFQLGGHSLSATRVVARLREQLQAEIALRKLFEHPVLANLAAYMATLESGSTGQSVLQPVDRRQPLPLSFSQRRLWLIDQYAQEDTSYNMPSALRLRGSLDVEALRRSFETL